MSSTVWKLVRLTTFVCAIVLLPSTSQAGSIPTDVQFAIINTGPISTDAPICPVATCQVSPDPMTGMGSQPAVSFDLDADQVVHIEADVHDGLGCQIFIDTAMGDLPLTAGHINVYLNFQPPLPDGTEVSLVWRVGADPKCATPCSDYTIGVDPAVCL